MYVGMYVCMYVGEVLDTFSPEHVALLQSPAGKQNLTAITIIILMYVCVCKMYVCMYVCMYECMRVCVCAYMYVCIESECI